jgi:hypothetical protein
MGEGEDEMIGEAGDWLVKTHDGDHIILTNDEFTSKYEPATTKTHPHHQEKKSMAPDDLFKLYEENQPSHQNTSVIGGYPQSLPQMHGNVMYQQSPQMPAQQQFVNLPPMIPSNQPVSSGAQAPQTPQKKKKSALGGLFGGGKKKRDKSHGKDDFTSDNVQVV